MTESLLIEWDDPTGETWDLGTGAQGVVLDVKQSGLGWSEINHITARGDQRLVSSTVKRGVHTLAVLVGEGLRGQALYALREKWWYHANSPYKYGTLRFTRPDGAVRSRRLRLAESPGTAFTYDPGLGLEDRAEAWVLTGNGPWWDGPDQMAQLSSKDFNEGGGTPFYGFLGAGWPLHIASPAWAHDAFLTNDGQGPMWPTWELVGPLFNPRFGVAGGAMLAYNGEILPGEIVVVTTDPERRGVVSLPTKQSRYRYVSGRYAPIPGGARVALDISAEYMSQDSSIIVHGTTKYAAAF